MPFRVYDVFLGLQLDDNVSSSYASKEDTAEGNSSVNKSTAVPDGNTVTIADLMDFVNSYSGKTIKING